MEILVILECITVQVSASAQSAAFKDLHKKSPANVKC